MLWYVPSWNGDLRFESTTEGFTLITVINPTPSEREQLVVMERIFYANGWLDGSLWDPKRSSIQSQIVQAPILEVGQRILAGYTRGRAVLTAIRFENDTIEAVEAGSGFWSKISQVIGFSGRRKVEVASDIRVPSDPSPFRQAEPVAAVTVKKPTSCCPNCLTGPMSPEKEVLFAFLSEEEKQQWAEDHAIVVVGGLTGHRYLLSHRNGPWAEKHTKICHDIDDDVTLHFHDNTVPAEEEVLGAKLILEHREHWLRHRASFFGETRVLFENPFGDISDGTRSACFVSSIGYDRFSRRVAMELELERERDR